MSIEIVQKKDLIRVLAEEWVAELATREPTEAEADMLAGKGGTSLSLTADVVTETLLRRAGRDVPEMICRYCKAPVNAAAHIGDVWICRQCMNKGAQALSRV